MAAVTREESGSLRFEAGEGSRWLPLYGSERAILQLQARDATGRESRMLPSHGIPIGQVLQSLRELANPHVLAGLELEVDQEPFDFVSYRIADGTRAAFELVSRLLESGRRVFWDRWSLPRRLAERREQVNGEALNRHLLDILEKAGVVWVIDSPLYAEPGSYSATELEVAKAFGKEIRIEASSRPR